MKKLIKYFIEKQKLLFLIDSLGAIITAFSLFVIIRLFDEYFRMPKTVLIYLSVIAIFFSIYSAACFLFLKRRFAHFIRLIGIANLLYCGFTIGLIIKYNTLLTIIEITYFSIEIIIICALSYIELNVAKEIKRSRSFPN